MFQNCNLIAKTYKYFYFLFMFPSTFFLAKLIALFQAPFLPLFYVRLHFTAVCPVPMHKFVLFIVYFVSSFCCWVLKTLCMFVCFFLFLFL